MDYDRDELISINPLFLAVTRPALWAGIPIEAGVLLLMVTVIVLIQFGNPVYAGACGAAGYALARITVRHDVNAFRLLFLWARTKMACPNRAFWGGSSYSPLPLKGLTRKGFGRAITRRG